MRDANRQRRAGQHQLQRARRADRLHAGRRLSLLHGTRDGRAGGRQHGPAQGGSAPGAARGAAEGRHADAGAAARLPQAARRRRTTRCWSGRAVRSADRKTGAIYPDRDGVPSLLGAGRSRRRPGDRNVKAFYEEHPFPNYDGVQEFGDLVTRGTEEPVRARTARRHRLQQADPGMRLRHRADVALPLAQQQPRARHRPRRCRASSSRWSTRCATRCRAPASCR